MFKRLFWVILPSLILPWATLHAQLSGSQGSPAVLYGILATFGDLTISNATLSPIFRHLVSINFSCTALINTTEGFGQVPESLVLIT